MNDLIDSLNYMKEQFNSKQCTSGEQDLKDYFISQSITPEELN